MTFIPQMNPANWIVLMLTFNFIIMILSSKLHFSSLISPSSMVSTKKFLNFKKFYIKF